MIIVSGEKAKEDLENILPLVHGRHVSLYHGDNKIASSYGTCLKCGTENQDLGDGLCLTCYDQVTDRNGLRYRHKALGLCVDCSQPALKPFVRCSRCLELRRFASNKYYRALVKGD